MTWCVAFSFRLFYSVGCDWHFSWIWHTEKCWNGKMLSSVIVEIWRQKKRLTNWAISQNANVFFVCGCFYLFRHRFQALLLFSYNSISSAHNLCVFFSVRFIYIFEIYDLHVYNNLYFNLWQLSQISTYISPYISCDTDTVIQLKAIKWNQGSKEKRRNSAHKSLKIIPIR